MCVRVISTVSHTPGAIVVRGRSARREKNGRVGQGEYSIIEVVLKDEWLMTSIWRVPAIYYEKAAYEVNSTDQSITGRCHRVQSCVVLQETGTV